MSEEFDIQGNVVVQTGDAEAALQKLRDKQAANDKAFSDKQAAAWSKVGSAALVAGAALAAGLGISLKNAAAAETAQLGLATSLRNTGQYSVATMAHIDALTNSLRKQTGVDDETQKAALSFASTMKLTETQAEALLPRLLDMSAVTGMDLQQGFRASAQAMTGNVGLFQRYGVIITKSKDGTVDFNNVLKQLQIYAGQASDKMSGAGGAGVKLKSALEELSESMGTALIPAATKAATEMTSLVEKFNDMPSAMQAVVTDSALAATGILLIGGAAQKTIALLATLKTGLATLTAGAGLAALATPLGWGALAVGVGAAAVVGAKAIHEGAAPSIETQSAATSAWDRLNHSASAPVVPSSSTIPWYATVAGQQAHTGYVPNPVPPPVSATAAQIAANADIAHKLYDASHTEKQQALHDLDLELAAYRKAGDDKVLIAQYSAAKRAEIEKQYAVKSAASAAAVAWSPINVSGVNVSGLSSYIGSLEGPVKVKKTEVRLTLKIDGTTIKIDQSALSKLKETLGNLVYAKVIAALGGSGLGG